jgi:hypothetical protein
MYIQTRADSITSEFWHSHEAMVGEDFVIANISQTLADRVVWDVSPTARILSQCDEYFLLQFSDTGYYEISLTAYVGECFREQTGVVYVVSYDEIFYTKSARTSMLSDLKLFPNPASEQFSFSVQSRETTALNWTLTRVGTGIVAASGQARPDSGGVAGQQISLQGLPRGVYVLRVFSGNEQLSAQLIIN